MSPNLIAIYEYRFVRPEDVNPETDTVVTEGGEPLDAGGVLDSRIWLKRAKGYAETAKALRERAEEYRRAAEHMEASAPTAERTVCVRRKVL